MLRGPGDRSGLAGHRIAKDASISKDSARRTVRAASGGIDASREFMKPALIAFSATTPGRMSENRGKA